MTLVVAALAAGATLVGIGLISTPASAILTSGFTITSTIYTTPSGPYGPSTTCSGTPAPLYPGVTRCVVFTVTNNLDAQIAVQSITTTLDPAYPAPPSGCAVANLNLPSFSGSFNVSGAGSSPLNTANSPGVPMSLVNAATPQNNCAGATLHFKYTGTAIYTEVYATSTAVTSSLNPSTVGQSATYTATVTASAASGQDPVPSSPTGTVTFYDGTVAPANIIPGCSAVALPASTPNVATATATCPSPAYASAGTHSITAVYANTDGNFTGSTSPVFTQTVNGAAGSKVFLWSFNNPTTVGSSLTYGADVLGPYSLPDLSATGTMTFSDNGVAIPSCVNVHVVLGFATCTVTYQSATNSPHTIVATYSGDAHHGAGTSNTVAETVNKATPRNVVTNSSPTTLGATLKFIATVSGGGITPTGTVTWTVSTLAGVTPCAATATLAGGTATCTITATRAGSYAVSDSYGGDGNYTTAGSSTDTVAVAKATPTNVVTNSAPPALGGTVTFTATITGVAGITPTGTVTWHVSGSAGATSCGTTTALSSGVATCKVTATRAGTYIVSDTYGGDGNYTTAGSNTDTVSVAKATPTNKVTNSSPTTLGSTVTFTATVAGVSGITPTGSVTWKVAGTAGVTSCTTSTTTLSSGTATCVIKISKSGTYAVYDIYGGDANYTSVTSSTDTVS